MDWEKLLDEHGSALLLYARQWCRSMTEAEDAVQDGFVRFWKSRGRTLEDPLPYLFATVKRTAIDRGRSASRRVRREEKAGEQLYDSPPMFECTLDAEDRRVHIEAAMQALPGEQREVLVMKIWGDLTFRQISEALGIPLNTAASRYRYALQALKKELTLKEEFTTP